MFLGDPGAVANVFKTNLRRASGPGGRSANGSPGGRCDRGLDRRDRPAAGKHRRARVDTAVGCCGDALLRAEDGRRCALNRPAIVVAQHSKPSKDEIPVDRSKNGFDDGLADTRPGARLARHRHDDDAATIAGRFLAGVWSVKGNGTKTMSPKLQPVVIVLGDLRCGERDRAVVSPLAEEVHEVLNLRKPVWGETSDLLEEIVTGSIWRWHSQLFTAKADPVRNVRRTQGARDSVGLS